MAILLIGYYVLYITGEKEKYDKDEYRYRRYIEINGWKNIREDIVLYCSVSVNVRIQQGVLTDYFGKSAIFD